MASGIKNFRNRLRNVLAAWGLLLATCALGTNINSARAADAYICKLFAREYLREIYVHNLKKPDSQPVDSQQKAIPETTDTTKLPFYYQKLIATCLAADKIPDLPDVPEATDKVWLEDLIGNHLSKASGPVAAVKPQGQALQQGEPAEGPAPVLASEQSKAEATCGRVNMRVTWTNNGRSWRCVK
jgi:hypothetical protein